uniref:Uncharacterized protein n=1 Tax=Picea glauca TaxID=3330 RepID=A0A117NJA7_PICGL|nr:hypothetical protein ABT39_MTgene1105 [Picea glauca]
MINYRLQFLYKASTIQDFSSRSEQILDYFRGVWFPNLSRLQPLYSLA